MRKYFVGVWALNIQMAAMVFGAGRKGEDECSAHRFSLARALWSLMPSFQVLCGTRSVLGLGTWVEAEAKSESGALGRFLYPSLLMAQNLLLSRH